MNKKILVFITSFLLIVSCIFLKSGLESKGASATIATVSIDFPCNVWRGDYEYGSSQALFNANCTFTFEVPSDVDIVGINDTMPQYTAFTVRFDSNNSKWFITPVDMYGGQLFKFADGSRRFNYNERVYISNPIFSLNGNGNFNLSISNPSTFYYSIYTGSRSSATMSLENTFITNWSFSSCNVNPDGVTSFSFYYDPDTIPWGSAFLDGNYYNSPLVFESFYIVVDNQAYYVPIEEKYDMFKPYVDISTSNNAYYSGYFVDTNNHVIRRYIQFSYVFDYLQLPNDTQVDYIYFTARYTFTSGVSNRVNVGISVPNNKYIGVDLSGYQNMGSFIASIESDFGSVSYDNGTTNNGNLNDGVLSWLIHSDRAPLVPTFSTDVKSLTDYVSGFFNTFASLCSMAFSWIPEIPLALVFLFSGLVAIAIIKAFL